MKLFVSEACRELSKIIQQDARDEAETESEILPGMLCWDTLAHA